MQLLVNTLRLTLRAANNPRALDVMLHQHRMQNDGSLSTIDAIAGMRTIASQILTYTFALVQSKTFQDAQYT